jgi:hypothetical protein
VIESDEDLALLTTGTTTYTNVLITPGTYNINSTLRLGDHAVKRFVGYGINQSILNVNYVLSSGAAINADSNIVDIGGFRLTTSQTQTYVSAYWIFLQTVSSSGIINVHNIKIDSMNRRGRGITTGGGSTSLHSMSNLYISDCFIGFSYCGSMSMCVADDCTYGFYYAERINGCVASNCTNGFYYSSYVSTSIAKDCTTGWSGGSKIDPDSCNNV